MRFGLSTISKLAYARNAAACLVRLLLRQRDAVGAMVLNDQRPLFVPPKQNAVHLRAVLSCLQAAEVGGGGCLGTQIRSVIPRLRRRGLFILFSDCFGELDELHRAVRVVALARPRCDRHERAGSGRDPFRFPALRLRSARWSFRASTSTSIPPRFGMNI